MTTPGSSNEPRRRLGLGVLVVACGMLAIVTQSLLLREALVLVYGSELAWGVVLSAWLLGVAIGGVLGGWLQARVKRPDVALVIVVVALSVAACIEIWMFRGVRAWLGVEPGEFLDLSTTTVAALVLVTPASSLVGIAFPLACNLTERREGHPGAGPLAGIYGLESAGSLIGGALFSFWAIETLSPIEIALSCTALALAASAGLLAAEGRRAGAAGAGALAMATLLVTILEGDALDDRLVRRRWQQLAPHAELVAEGESRYQNLAVGRLAEQYTLYSDGQAVADFPDPYTWAPLAHFWMTQHPSPRRVLVLGGGAEGLLVEILRHPVVQIDYVEPDPLQMTIVEPYLPRADRRALRDERVRVHHEDARFFIKRLRERFDLVIARLPEPTSAQRSRFYTVQFFGELRRAMSDRAVLCMTVAAPPGRLTRVSGEYLASVWATVGSHFPEILVGWGDPAHLIAATTSGLATMGRQELVRRYTERGVRSDRFDPAWLEGATDWLDPDKVELRTRELEQVETVAVSTDLHPQVYLQRLVLWDRMTGGDSFRIVERLRSLDWPLLVVALLLLAVVTLVAIRARSRRVSGWTSAVVTVSIGATGFASMALSIIWLFAFQSLYGYVYQRIGWIIALFMAGLAAGSALVAYRCKRVPAARLTPYLHARLILVDVLLAVSALAVPLLLPALGAMQTGPLTLLLVEAIASAAVAQVGMLGGAAFALAGGLQVAESRTAGKAAGVIVAADHAGACLGALLTGLLLVPVYGTITAACLLGGIKLATAAALGLARRAEPAG